MPVGQMPVGQMPFDIKSFNGQGRHSTVVEQATNDCVIKSSNPAPPSTPDERAKKKILVK